MDWIKNMDETIKWRLIGLAMLVFFMGLMSGCAMFDLDGNGKIDPIAYLENTDITVAWTDDDGKEYVMAVDEMGRKLVGQFIQAKTGYLFEVADDGAVTITDPAGMKIKLARKQ